MADDLIVVLKDVSTEPEPVYLAAHVFEPDKPRTAFDKVTTWPLWYKRYDHAVIETAAILASEAVGSMSGTPTEKIEEMRHWLEYRVERDWQTDDQGWNRRTPAACAAYDNAVRALARAALALAVGGGE